jgi:protein-tyrosine-phosphatase
MKITFVCVGNTCRSPMLRALFETYAKEQGFCCEVKSAGLFVTDGKVSPYAEKILLDYGIPVQNQNTTVLDHALIADSNLIVAVDDFVADKISKTAESKVYSLSSPLLLGEGLIDPYGQGIEGYKAVFDKAKSALPKILALAKLIN